MIEEYPLGCKVTIVRLVPRPAADDGGSPKASPPRPSDDEEATPAALEVTNGVIISGRQYSYRLRTLEPVTAEMQILEDGPFGLRQVQTDRPPVVTPKGAIYCRTTETPLADDNGVVPLDVSGSFLGWHTTRGASEVTVRWVLQGRSSFVVPAMVEDCRRVYRVRAQWAPGSPSTEEVDAGGGEIYADVWENDILDRVE